MVMGVSRRKCVARRIAFARASKSSPSCRRRLRVHESSACRLARDKRQAAPHGKYADDERHPVTSHVTVEGGSYHWKVDGKLVTEDVVGDEIEGNAGPTVLGSPVRSRAHAAPLASGSIIAVNCSFTARTN